MKVLMLLILLVSTSLAAADITRLNWLAGCWTYDGQPAGSGEYWMPPVGGMMLAVSRNLRDGRTVGYEYLRIEETAGDSLVLVASPSGQTPAQFDLLNLTDSEVVFENLEHDFPQRISYRLSGAGTLLGRIAGKIDDQPVVIDFPMTGISCADFGQ